MSNQVGVENKFTVAMVQSQDLDKIKAFKLSIWMGGTYKGLLLGVIGN